MNIVNKYKIFLSFLNKRQKIKFYLIVLLMIFQSILEVLGIGAVIPLLSIIIVPKESFYLDFLNFFLKDFSFPENYLVIIFLLLVVIFFFFKTYFLYFCSRKIFNFAYEIQTLIKDKIFTQSIYMNYSEFLKTKSSILVSNVSTNTNLITQYCILPILSFTSEGLILLSILLFLLFYQTSGFLILFLAISTTILITYNFFSKKLKKMGSDKEILESKIIKLIQNSIGSIKITKLHNLENKYLEEFEKINVPVAVIQSKSLIYNHLPRFILELLGAMIICGMVFFFIFTGQDSLKIITIISIFAAAGFKIIPGVNRIIFSLQGLKYSESFLITINKIFEYYNEKKLSRKKENKKVPDLSFVNSIEFKNISFRYTHDSNLILDNFSFSIKKNKKIGIVGSSGTGKTTFLDLLIGLLEPTSGKILVDKKIVSLNNPGWRNNIAYVPQYNYLIDDTLEKNISLEINDKNIDHTLVDSLIDLTFLKNELVDKNPNGKQLLVGEKGANLSGGQIQRIGIARALYKKPKLLIMDEPTSSLDSANEKKIINIINKIKNLTLVIVSHRKSTLEGCDKIFTFKNGKCIRNV
jgi:ABC-type multidrug transport system fused ATPase/permease subunit